LPACVKDEGEVFTVIVLRKTVIALPEPEPETDVARFDVFPSAVTAVEVAIEKTCDELSVAPPPEYVATSPFRVTSVVFACGTTIGVAKWNA